MPAICFNFRIDGLRAMAGLSIVARVSAAHPGAQHTELPRSPGAAFGLTRATRLHSAARAINYAPPTPDPQGTPMAFTTTASGLQFEDTVVGSGAEAKPGRNVTVHYTGWLYENGEQGAKFDSSKD